VRDRFVPVSIEIAYSGKRADVEGKFIRDRLQRPSWNGWIAATPNGVILNEEPYLDIVIHKGLEKWNQLPEADRRPGLKLEDLGSADPALDLQPPPGAKVLNVYLRSLDQQSTGKLTVPLKIDLENPGAPPIDAQAQRDRFWMIAEEAASLIPSERKIGSKFPVPAFLAERICRFHLKDSATCIPGTSASKYGGYSGSMTATVAEGREGRLCLHLEGKATGNGPDFELRGIVEVHPGSKQFTRFDLTAYSEKGHTDKKSGRQVPLGMAFELAPSDSAMDRLPPYFFTLDRWANPKGMMEAYFKPAK
jgi:hypothetical protein